MSNDVQEMENKSELQHAVSKALDVLNEAAQEPDRERRIEIANKALGISRNCIEAWLLLANESAQSMADAVTYLREAVDAGDRLFADRKDEWMGRFWQVAQTRPYMHARAGLGQVLWETGEHENAIDVLEATLRLNPVDHQGIRFVLLRALLELERYADAEKIANEYEAEQSTPMLYNRLLLAYAVHGDSLVARSVFLAARKANPFVLDYLLGLRVAPQKLPKESQPGEESEAIRYMAAFGDAFSIIPGVTDFLRAQKKLRMQKEEIKKDRRNK